MTRLLDRLEPEAPPATAGSDDWQYTYVEFGAEGLQADREPGLLGDAALLNSLNVALDYETLRSEFGYNLFNDTPINTGFGPVRAFFVFERQGVEEFIAITDNALFRYEVAIDQFVPIGDQDLGQLLTQSQASGSDVFKVTTAYEVGVIVTVEMDNGKWHIATVTEKNAGGIVGLNRVSSVFPVALSIGGRVRPVNTLNGIPTEQVVVTAMSGTGELYFTNGVDRPKRYNGSVHDIDGLPGTTFRCKNLCTHYARLLLGNTTEDDGAHGTRFRWSEIGTANVWPPENFLDLTETIGSIVAMVPLNKDIIMYKERSIFRVEHVGSPDLTWDAIKTIEDEGAVSALCVIPVINVHAFRGRRNFYLYDGQSALQPIGNQINDLLLGPRRRVDKSSLKQCFGVFNGATEEVWWFFQFDEFPELDSLWDDGTPWDDGTGWDPLPASAFLGALRYKLSHNAWTLRLFPFSITAIRDIIYSTELTYKNATITYDAADFSYAAGGGGDLVEVLTLFNGTTGEIYKFDFTSNTDNGDLIPWRFETREFFFKHNMIRFDRFDITMGGGPALLYYSTDKGTTWNYIGTVPQSTQVREFKIWKQFVAREVRFLLSSADFLQMTHFGFRWRRESLT